MKNVLVTGATGFIGRPLTLHLLDEGYQVTVLAREPASARDLAARGARVIPGNLTVSTSFDKVIEEVDGLFHLAALTDGDHHVADLRRVNIIGTRNVLDAASRAGVERVVYCGCTSSLGDTGGETRDESHDHDGSFSSVAEVTKQGAHRLVEKRMSDGEPIVNAVVSTAYGPGDQGVVGDLIGHHLAGLALAHLNRCAGLTLTHVDDVAVGLRLAYERGEVGERYLIADTPATYGQFFEHLADQTGISEPRTQLPDWLGDVLPGLTKRLAPLSADGAVALRSSLVQLRRTTRFYSGAKARQELGWSPRGLRQGLRDTLPWYRRREQQAADRMLQSTAVPLLGMTLFDIGLGLAALAFPKMYVDLMHPHEGGLHLPAARSLLARTGLLWLFFAFVQGMAGSDPVKRPEWVLIAGALRLMDVPADIGYALTSDDKSALGKAGLIAAPVFNLSIGSLLAYAGYRGLRAKLSR